MTLSCRHVEISKCRVRVPLTPFHPLKTHPPKGAQGSPIPALGVSSARQAWRPSQERRLAMESPTSAARRRHMKTEMWSSSHPDTLHHPFSSTLLRPGHLCWKPFRLATSHCASPQSCLGELFSRPWVTPPCRHEAGRQWTSVRLSIITSVSEGAGWKSFFLCYTILHATAGEYFSLKPLYTIFLVFIA